MTINQCVRAINEAIRHTSDSVYLRVQGTERSIRVLRARRKRAWLEVQSLSTGTWIMINPTDHIEQMHGARVVAVYAWRGPGHQVDAA